MLLSVARLTTLNEVRCYMAEQLSVPLSHYITLRVLLCRRRKHDGAWCMVHGAWCMVPYILP